MDQYANGLVPAVGLCRRLFPESARRLAVAAATHLVENDFELTGPIQRGDWETVDRHLEAIQASRPELEALYRVLADATAAVA